MTITQVITPLPAAPNPATDTPTVFSEKAAAFVAAQQVMVPEINAWRIQANALEANVNAKEAATDADVIATAGLKNTAQSAADAAESYRTQAQASASAAAASATTIGTTAAFSDANPIAKNAANNTKTGRFDLSLISPSTQCVIQWPDKNGKMALVGDGGLAFLSEIILAAPAAAIDFLTIFDNPSHDRFLITIQKIATTSGAGNLALRYAIGGTVITTGYTTTVMSTGAAYGGGAEHRMGTVSPGLKSFEITIFDKGWLSERPLVSTLAGSNGIHITGNLGGGGAANASGFRIFTVEGLNMIAGSTVRVYGYAKS